MLLGVSVLHRHHSHDAIGAFGVMRAEAFFRKQNELLRDRDVAQPSRDPSASPPLVIHEALGDLSGRKERVMTEGESLRLFLHPSQRVSPTGLRGRLVSWAAGVRTPPPAR